MLFDHTLHEIQIQLASTVSSDVYNYIAITFDACHSNKLLKIIFLL